MPTKRLQKLKKEISTMGLAASQARLLTITSRKSNAQFESMRLSHQKLALARNLTDVSNEYQNSLKQTRLFYDFYGNGSTDNLMSYGLFMTPSFINDYTPVLVTNRQNRIVLSTVFAEAARSAGIPQEGLNGVIDDETRNKFIRMLQGFGEIDEPTANLITGDNGVGIPYNPLVGLGYTAGLTTTDYATEDYSRFQHNLENVVISRYYGLNSQDLYNTLDIGNKSQITAYTVDNNVSYHYGIEPDTILGAEEINDNKILRLTDTHGQKFCHDGETASFGTSNKTWDSLSLYDILYGSDDIILTQNVQCDREVTDALNPHQYDDLLTVVQNVIGLLSDQLTSRYGLDENVALAINYANANMNACCWDSSEPQTLAVYTASTLSADQGNQNKYDVINPSNNNENPYPRIDNLSFNQDFLSNIENTGEGNNNEIFISNESNLRLLDLPDYTFSQENGAYIFYTGEDISSPNGPQYYDMGYEPYSYWVSVPNTIEDGSVSYKVPSYGTDSNGNPISDPNYDNGDINTARRNATVYALFGAKNNLALLNMYDNTYNLIDNDDAEPDNGNYGAINLSAFVKAWYTFFIQSVAQSKINDASLTDDERALCTNLLEGQDALSINFHQKNENSQFATVNQKYVNGQYESVMVDLSGLTFQKSEIVLDDGINDFATFYDTIINQICEYGWTENNEVKEDPMYLQEMIKSGKMFLFKLANDNFYYQKNYSSDTFIKEIADETAIAQAEAKYKTQKSRINAKEQEIDIKMKNLDTEISSLETEYEAVKKMISNNTQKAFARYQS